MGLSLLLFVTLTVCFHSVFSLDCTDSPGISFIPCQNPSGSSSGGSGGTAGADSPDPTAIQPCTDIQYNGRPPQRYTVEDQGLPEEFELVFDTLNIPDGDRLVIRSFKCGSNNECKIAVIDSTASTPLSVSINKHTFALASSSSSVSATFKINYECSSPGCGEDYTAETGTLNFPESTGSDYLTNLDCVWSITTTPGNVLQLTFTAFSLESSNGCIYDYLQVENESNRFCGTNAPGTNGVYTATSNNIELIFHSDSEGTSTGFQLTWATVTNSR